MNFTHTDYWEQDRVRSANYIEGLKVPLKEAKLVDNWFFDFLLAYQQANSFEVAVSKEVILQSKADVLTPKLGIPAINYWVGKLIKYNNAIHTGELKPQLVARLGILLKNLINQLLENKGFKVSVSQFIALIEYLQNEAIAPNSNMLEYLLKIQQRYRICKLSTHFERFIITKAVLEINASKKFHKDIKCYKKVLEWIEKEDSELVNFIYQYTPNNNQGCYDLIQAIYRHYCLANSWDDFLLKKDLILCFDTARGAQPSTSWSKKLLDIRKRINKDTLLELCTEILIREDLLTHAVTGKADEVVKRFFKAAAWAMPGL